MPPEARSANPLMDTRFASGRAQQEAEQRPGFLSDFGQTVVAKGARGVAAIPGLPGDVAQMIGRPTNYLPTTNDIISRVGSVSPGVRRALDYQPQHAINRYVGSVAEALPSAMIPLGGGIGAGARFLGGVGSGVAIQGVDDVFKGSPQEGSLLEGGAKLAAGVLGGMGGMKTASGLSTAFRPADGLAMDRLAAGLSRDLKVSGRNPAAALNDAASAGIPPAALAGRATKNELKKAAARSGDEAVGAFNTSLKEAAAGARSALDDAVDAAVQRPGLNAFQAIDDIGQRIRQVNDANYARVMAMPQARNLSSPELSAIAQRLPQGTLRDVAEELRISGVNPSAVGLVKTRNGFEISPQGASLRLWDEIKQNIDSRIGSMVDPVTRSYLPGKGSQAASLQQLKSNLVGVLDGSIDAYKQIRFEGAQLYGARNAIEAGYKLFSDIDPKSLHAKRKLIASLPASQKEDLAVGFAGALKDALAKDPAAAMRMFAGSGGTFNVGKMNLALGPQRAQKLMGAVSQQQLTLGLQALQQHPGFLSSLSGAGKEVSKAGLMGALGAAAGEALMVGGNIMQVANMAVTPAMAVGAVAGLAGRGVLRAKEAKVGEQVLRIAADPSRAAELGALIQRNGDARSFISKFLELTARATPPAASTTTEDVPRYGQHPDVLSQRPLTIPGGQRASGGRVERASGGRVRISDRLMLAVERARREVQAQTKPILNAPDETVVRALKVAQQHI